jgi:uncharacterized protein DUF4118
MQIREDRFWRSGIRALLGSLSCRNRDRGLLGALRLNLTVTAFLYLIIVVLQSLIGDFVSSAVVSIVADLALNFFFAPPLFSFRVSDSSDFWGLIAFLLTGLIITRLTTKGSRDPPTGRWPRRSGRPCMADWC